MSRLLQKTVALACLTLGSISAHADNLAFGGYANGYQTVNFALSGSNAPTSGYAGAGGFLASLNGGASFVSYCVDLYQSISFGGSGYNDYSRVNGSAHAFANAHASADIGKLYSEHNVVNDSVSQAAFQIAVWEIAYETSGTYNLGNGAATFSGGTAASSGALALASSWLGALGNTANTYSLSVFESPTHQDQVYAAPIPEPSTYAMMAAGLVGMGFIARRRSLRQS
ncbi:MAG TPA: PEP-CTERM sorting domain-containing protein [Burkholderiaceae bacterium]|nr:PEP-CTERM sorting domain-containing protein [Burkholderiaceae bacterium]